MTAKRVVQGVLYAHGGQVFAFLDTEQPYDIPGCAALMRRARSYSGNNLGTLTVRMMEHERFPDTQGFAVFSDRRNANRGQFAEVVANLFPGYTLEAGWVTNFRQQDGHLLWALVARKLLTQA
jgi:hypothetical protein